MSSYMKNGYSFSNAGRINRVINSNDIIEQKLNAIRLEEEKRNLEKKKKEFRERKLSELAQLEESGEIPEGEEGDAFRESFLAQEPSFDLEEDEETVAPLEEDVDPVALAREEAEKILTQAEAKATAIIDKAYLDADTQKKLGHDEGFSAGYEEGLNKANSEIEIEKEKLKRLEEELRLTHENAMNEMEPAMLETMLNIFSRVFDVEFRDKKAIIEALAKSALRNIKETKQYKLRVSPQDEEFLRERKSELKDVAGSEAQIEIIPDNKLEVGSLIIDTDNGVYDCSIDVELDNLKRDLRLLSGT